MLVKQHNIIIIPLKKTNQTFIVTWKPIYIKNDSPSQLTITMVCRYFLQCAREQWYSGMCFQWCVSGRASMGPNAASIFSSKSFRSSLSSGACWMRLKNEVAGSVSILVQLVGLSFPKGVTFSSQRKPANPHSKKLFFFIPFNNNFLL